MNIQRCYLAGQRGRFFEKPLRKRLAYVISPAVEKEQDG